jgi:hypothetical protein
MKLYFAGKLNQTELNSSKWRCLDVAELCSIDSKLTLVSECSAQLVLVTFSTGYCAQFEFLWITFNHTPNVWALQQLSNPTLLAYPSLINRGMIKQDYMLRQHLINQTSYGYWSVHFVPLIDGIKKTSRSICGNYGLSHGCKLEPRATGEKDNST